MKDLGKKDTIWSGLSLLPIYVLKGSSYFIMMEKYWAMFCREKSVVVIVVEVVAVLLLRTTILENM